MTMYCIKGVLIFLAVPFALFGQNEFESLGESSFSLNQKVNSRLDFNYSLRSRYFLYKDSEFTYDQRQLDLVHFTTYALNLNNSLSFGIQYRNRSIFNDRGNELRFTQQFNHTSTLEKFRFGHRLRIEQRILEDITLWRSRYRFAIDFPLNGLKLDVGESYLVSSMEVLLTQNRAIKSEIDHRTTIQIGWQMSETLKLQTGLEYRFEAFNIDTQHLLFVLTSAVLKI